MQISEPAKKPKILLVWIGRLGDLLVSTGFIAALRKKYPGHEITLLARGYVRELASMIPAVDDIAILPDHGHPAQLPGFIKKIVLRRYELCVDLNPSYSRMSGFLALLSGAQKRISFDKYRAGWFYTGTVAAPGETEHMLSRYGRLAGFFGADYSPRMEIAVPETAGLEAEKLLAALSLDGKKRKVAVHPGNFKKFDHRWPEEKFSELARRIAERNDCEIIYLAGPGEQKQVRAIAGTDGKVVPPAPVPVTAALLRKMDLIIVSATGTMHLAAAVETPMLSFHSRYTYDCWRPLQGENIALASDNWNSCRDIPVDKAWEAVRQLLDKRKTSE